MTFNGPLWTQEQAIAYEAAIEAINDVIAGYSEALQIARQQTPPDQARIAWLRMRTDHAHDLANALNVTDDEGVAEVLRDFGAMVRARNAAQGD